MASRAVSLKPEPGAVTDREGQLASRDNLALAIGLLVPCRSIRSSTPSSAWTRLGAMECIMVYVILAMGLNIVVGYAGLLDLGYAAFLPSARTPWVPDIAGQLFCQAGLGARLFTSNGVLAGVGGFLGRRRRSSACCLARRRCACAAIISRS